MTARMIRESYDGGSIEVEPYDRATRPYAHPSADGRIVLEVTERGMDVATLHLTPAETAELVAALNAKLVELATQTAPDGAGAAPIRGNEGQVAPSTQEDAGGQNRTTAGHGSPSAAVPGCTTETTFEAGAAFFRDLGHGPTDGCDPENPWGARPEVWRLVHQFAAETAESAVAR